MYQQQWCFYVFKINLICTIRHYSQNDVMLVYERLNNDATRSPLQYCFFLNHFTELIRALYTHCRVYTVYVLLYFLDDDKKMDYSPRHLYVEINCTNFFQTFWDENMFSYNYNIVVFHIYIYICFEVLYFLLWAPMIYTHSYISS